MEYRTAVFETLCRCINTLAYADKLCDIAIMGVVHNYKTHVKWTGNKGAGTASYEAYDRSFTLSMEGKEDILCSADIPFRGDGSKYNPEDMLLSSLSSCHMLWFLHLCADEGIVVLEYEDQASGVLTMMPESSKFSRVDLFPIVTIEDESKAELANSLHTMARNKCFIANSVNFPVEHHPICKSL